jgi:hypothetical protein
MISSDFGSRVVINEQFVLDRQKLVTRETLDIINYTLRMKHSFKFAETWVRYENLRLHPTI